MVAVDSYNIVMMATPAAAMLSNMLFHCVITLLSIDADS
jgi:hypothetical protein